LAEGFRLKLSRRPTAAGTRRYAQCHGRRAQGTLLRDTLLRDRRKEILEMTSTRTPSRHRLAKILAAAGTFAASLVGSLAGAQPAASAKLYFPACPTFAQYREADCYRSFTEVERFLRDAAAAHPELATLESIGKSFQGRDLWVLTITDRSAGAPEDKPAIWVDGGIDADEVIAIEAALGLVHRLLADPGERVRRLVRERTFHVAPAVIPDSSELHMTTPERPDDTTLRPWDDDNDGRSDEDGPEDLDGDGEALAMRQEDPNGDLTLDERDPRLLRERRPGDAGPFFRRWLEGTDDDGDGRYGEDRLGGVDPNRNYPGNWSLEQGGSGPFGGSEAEVRALVDFVLARPNVAASQHFHSAGGVVLRPPSVPDFELPESDLELYLRLAERGLEITGYDLATSVYDWNWPRGTRNTRRGQIWRDEEGELQGGPSTADGYAAYGGSIDALYELFGVVAFANEIYQLGEDDDGDGRVEDHERLHANDVAMDGRAWKPWTPFDHPQLGRVEIGGWRKFGYNNPLPPRLAEEVRVNVEFALMQAESTQDLEITAVAVESLGGDVHRVKATVENVGFAPTELAIRTRRGAAVPVRAAVRGERIEVLSDPAELELGQLAGHSRREADWLVRGPAGATLEVEARHPKAGVARRSAVLP
jgi:hypothetical protein